MAKGHIKNWTITSESIKGKQGGLIGYIAYLNDPKHPNHKNTEIKPIFAPQREQENIFIKKCCEEVLDLNLKNQKAKKGGSPIQSYAVGFDLVLPPGTVQPTQEQWKKIAQDTFRTAKANLDGTLTQEHVYMNIHDQANPHLNLVISKVIDGKRERKVDQKAFLHELKQSFNKSVLEHCGVDYKEYVPDNVELGKRKKRWQYDIDQIKKAHKQFEALIKYANENNHKRMNSSKNRIIKTLDGVSENNINEFLETAKEIQDPQVQELLEEIREATKPSQNDTKGGRKGTKYRM